MVHRAQAPAIRVDRLVRHFGPVRAVDGLSFQVPRGAICGLIGPNGAGKTTTLRILATLDVADAGQAQVAGFDALSHPWEVRRRIGFVSETTGVVEHLTVQEYLVFLGQCRGLRGQALAREIAFIASAAGIIPLAAQLVSGLSKGQLRRLGVAGALLGGPTVLLLDEPAAGLDPTARRELRDLLRTLVEQADLTVLISSHILSELQHLVDHLIVVNKGRVAYEGPAEGLGVPDAQARMEIEPAAGTLPQVVRWLREQPDVSGVTRQGDMVHALLEAAPEVVLTRAIQAGLTLRQYRVLPQDLEALYLNAVEQSGGA